MSDVDHLLTIKHGQQPCQPNIQCFSEIRHNLYDMKIGIKID